MIKFRIHVLMAEKRMTQKELSEKTGIHPSLIAKYYHDVIVRINREHLNAFCRVFNCDIKDLIEYTPDQEPSEE